MIKIVIVALATLIPLAPAVIYFMSLHTQDPVKAAQKLVSGFKGYNIVLLLMGLGLAVVWLFSPQTVLAAAAQQGSSDGTALGLQYLAAAVSTGLAALGAGVAVSGTGAAAIGAITEKPEALGRSLIFVGLAEGVAIYGLLISFLVLPK